MKITLSDTKKYQNWTAQLKEILLLAKHQKLINKKAVVNDAVRSYGKVIGSVAAGNAEQLDLCTGLAKAGNNVQIGVTAKAKL